tara:strand:+ start:1373 stop:1903 length:531 start_codon:yes stop_codon:yes gene_type:complete
MIDLAEDPIDDKSTLQTKSLLPAHPNYRESDDAIIQIGFTGTQLGMNETQWARVHHLLYTIGPDTFVHGDCLGADHDFHRMVRQTFEPEAIDIIIYPPDNTIKRAFCDGDIVMDEAPYLVRNQSIIDACDILIATPAEETEQRRSGTWSTIRKARKSGKPIYIVPANAKAWWENQE